jgi:hypothetical protein
MFVFLLNACASSRKDEAEDEEFFAIFYHNIKLIFLYATKRNEKMFSCSIEIF